MVSGRRPVRKLDRVGQQMACCTYARSKTTDPSEAASCSSVRQHVCVCVCGGGGGGGGGGSAVLHTQLAVGVRL